MPDITVVITDSPAIEAAIATSALVLKMPEQGPPGRVGDKGDKGDKGDDGDDGDPGPAGADAPEVKFQYSPDGSSGWHFPAVSGDFFMRTSSDDGVSWSGEARILGELEYNSGTW